MKIGIIDVDGHNFPNLALMRISAYHKSHGDDVEWWWGWGNYDIVYMSKVFSNEYSVDVPEPMNAKKVIRGGTGYCITLENGKEVFHKEHNASLPMEIERMFPDYSLYPMFKYAVSMTTRGCPKACGPCHVSAKEGRCTVKVADVADFWCGQKEIKVLDANITACRKKRELFKQYIDTGARIDFTQGLDMMLLDDADIDDINNMRISGIHFAWDDAKEDLKAKFTEYTKKAKHKPHGQYGTVYVLTNFNSTMEENLYRIYTLLDLGYDPFVMIYDKPHAPSEIRRLQRWCNNRRIFRSCHRFENYIE